jgi:hypothetical protein
MSVRPGIVSNRPSWATGTPNAKKSMRADQAEPSCSKATIQLNKTCGNGTRPNRNNNGNRSDREAAEPKQSTNDPIHHRTSANILIESCTSAGNEADQSNAEQAIKTAINRKAGPVLGLQLNFAFRDFQFRKIRAALTGRIRRM